jgi:hypothetical protein
MKVKMAVSLFPPTAVFEVFAPNNPEVNFTRCIKAKTLPALRSELDRRLAITWSGDIETALDSGQTATGEIALADTEIADYLAIEEKHRYF